MNNDPKRKGGFFKMSEQKLIKGKILNFYPDYNNMEKSCFTVILKNNQKAVLPLTEAVYNENDGYIALSKNFIGKESLFKVINDKESYIVSQKQAINQMIENLQIGEIITVKVIDTDSKGAILEKEGILYFMPKEEACHLSNPLLSKLFNEGEEIKVQITDITDNKQILVTHKPFSNITEEYIKNNYPAGSFHFGVITNLLPKNGKTLYFIHIEPGIDIICRIPESKLSYKNLAPHLKSGIEVITRIERLSDKKDKIYGEIIEMV